MNKKLVLKLMLVGLGMLIGFSSCPQPVNKSTLNQRIIQQPTQQQPR